MDGWGPSPLWWSHPGLVVLGSIKKQAEQAMVSNPVTSTPSYLLHQFLPPGSGSVWIPVQTSFSNGLQGGSGSQMNPFLSSLLLVMAFHHINSNPDYKICPLVFPCGSRRVPMCSTKYSCGQKEAPWSSVERWHWSTLSDWEPLTCPLALPCKWSTGFSKAYNATFHSKGETEEGVESHLQGLCLDEATTLLISSSFSERHLVLPS